MLFSSDLMPWTKNTAAQHLSAADGLKSLAKSHRLFTAAGFHRYAAEL